MSGAPPATSSSAATTPSPSLTSISSTQCPRPAATRPMALPMPPACAAPTAILEQILQLEEIDTNMYRGYSPQVPRWGRIYGGQTVAQALVASCRTVDPSFVCHSLHAYFLRPGNDDLPIMYYVERLRNGKSFANRRVTALQKGVAIFSMNVSFMVAEPGREHQDVMPQVPGPENIQSLMSMYRDIIADPRTPARTRKGLERSLTLPFPVDLRRVTPSSLTQRLKVNDPVQRSWIRVEGQLSDSLMLHQCALAYMSDWSLLETTLLPHALHGLIPADDSSVQMASIDHAMWFHHGFRADEWLLYDMYSPAASGGRGLARGRFFNREGKLIVSTAQEGLIRVHQGPPPAIHPVGAKKPTKTAESEASGTGLKQIKSNL